MRRFSLLVPVLLVFALLGADAYGHAHLLDPMRRANCQGGDDSTCKIAPQGTAVDGQCGGEPNPAVTPTVFYVGSAYTLVWEETIEHVSSYRLALSTNGETAFDSFVVMPYDTVIDDVGPALYEFIWTVPDTQNCNPCVMQLIQDMGASDYFNCADIRILQVGQTPPTPTPTPPAPTPTPGNPNDPVEVDAYGSCSVGPPATLWSGLPIALGLLLLLRRRLRV